MIQPNPSGLCQKTSLFKGHEFWHKPIITCIKALSHLLASLITFNHIKMKPRILSNLQYQCDIPPHINNMDNAHMERIQHGHWYPISVCPKTNMYQPITFSAKSAIHGTMNCMYSASSSWEFNLFEKNTSRRMWITHPSHFNTSPIHQIKLHKKTNQQKKKATITANLIQETSQFKN